MSSRNNKSTSTSVLKDSTNNGRKIVKSKKANVPEEIKESTRKVVEKDDVLTFKNFKKTLDSVFSDIKIHLSNDMYPSGKTYKAPHKTKNYKSDNNSLIEKTDKTDQIDKTEESDKINKTDNNMNKKDTTTSRKTDSKAEPTPTTVASKECEDSKRLLEELKLKLDEAEKKIHNLEVAKQSLKSDVDSLTSKMRSLNLSVENEKENNQKLSNEVEKKNSEYLKMEKRKNKYKKDCDDLEFDLKKAYDQIKELYHSLDLKDDSLADSKNKIQSLESMLKEEKENSLKLKKMLTDKENQLKSTEKSRQDLQSLYLAEKIEHQKKKRKIDELLQTIEQLKKENQTLKTAMEPSKKPKLEDKNDKNNNKTNNNNNHNNNKANSDNLVLQLEKKNKELEDKLEIERSTTKYYKKLIENNPLITRAEIDICSMVEYIIYDTNVYIDHLDHIKMMFQLYNTTIILPLAVSTELDGLKNNVAVETQVRTALRWLNTVCPTQPNKIRGQTVNEIYNTNYAVRPKTNDERIINCCLYFKSKTDRVLLVSNDVNMCLQASTHYKLPVMMIDQFIKNMKFDSFSAEAITKSSTNNKEESKRVQRKERFSKKSKPEGGIFETSFPEKLHELFSCLKIN
eukprot:TRINITY_DN2852_c0_g1_i2.p1 TRINITY_DN2852_c0_g1~~TRINITY_DN2852_c0_g1_i2.p1  ORF type:complete len:625 (-),score=172.09 TRINITY_DN2852_c0_g1_i2:107-1981(-)